MNKRKIQEGLLLGLLVAAACVAPLACSDGDEVAGPGEDAGASGSPETAGNGGSAAHGGQGGNKAVGGAATGGADMGGADMGGADMGGADMGGADMGGADMGGANVGGGAGSLEPGAAGEGGTAGSGNPVDEAALNPMHLDAICTAETSLGCSAPGMPPVDKPTCVDGLLSFPVFAPTCVPEIKAYFACLAPQPATSYECVEGAAQAKESVCADPLTAMNNCFVAQ